MAIDFQDNMILLTRKYLKRKIMCPETKFRHHMKERLHILDLLKRTVEMGESNSALLIGPRGSGKTTVCILMFPHIFMQAIANPIDFFYRYLCIF